MNLPTPTTAKHEITVTLMLEPQASGGFVASAVEFPGCRVAAATREDAIALVSDRLQAQLDHVEFVPLSLSLRDKPPAENPWKPLFGLYKDDPDFAEIAAAMRAEREVEDDSEVDPSVYQG
jgi:predicted RNase H-like HicB family nuclease